MITFPNCKINLGLDITERRPDGYHNLRSIFVPVGWCDILEAVPARELSLTVTGNGCDCPQEKNLVWRAWEAIHAAAPEKVGTVDIHLHKVIPDGAGLGGGSADAAFMLKMLNEMFGIGLDTRELHEIAASLGADCAFFIHNRPMLATGTGTELAPVTLPSEVANLQIAVVKPGVSVSTKEAYSRVKPAQPTAPTAHELPVESWAKTVKNDFEPSVFAVAPEVGEVKRRLEALGPVYASMSGSGSAVYALFRPGESDSARIEEEFPNLRTWTGPLINQQAL